MSRPVILGARCLCGRWLGAVTPHIVYDPISDERVESVTGICKRHGPDQVGFDYEVWWTGDSGLDEVFAATANGGKP